MERVPNMDVSTISRTIGVFKGKWKPWIIWAIYKTENNRMRYNELKRALPSSATHKMLTQHLRELEEDDILLRDEYDEMPPRVEYSLTAKGQSLARLLGMISAWGNAYPQRSNGTDHIA